MKITTSVFILFMIIGAGACKNDAPVSTANPNNNNNDVPADVAATANGQSTGATGVDANTPAVQPITAPGAAPSATPGLSNQPAKAAGTTAPGMNPPHGQPGHRCDIAVGAPLDSKPKQSNTAVQPQPAAAPSATPGLSNQPVKLSPNSAGATAPGMNPPHGQPGHRCDIAVGAPLDSKPKQ